MNKIELLAPAGNLEKLKTAVLYGADAVYLGGECFSLRTAADNFNDEQLNEGIEFAHAAGVKVHVAMNIIPHNRDLEKMKEFISKLKSFGIDAVIVADIGAFSLIKSIAPELEVHISTQANTVNYASAEAWYKMGASRVVLARELSMEEIREIRAKTDKNLELEMFVHGAMCMSYSGRCLLSNYMIDRDSNYGDCAQPCRWKYSLVEEKRPGEYMPVEETEQGTFIFNSKDLCLIEHIPEIIEAGVSSIKIEGRVKSEYYVATVVKAYREAIDEYYKDPENYKFDEEYKKELCKVSHRDYWEGFYFGRNMHDGQVYGTSSYIRDYDIVGFVTGSDGDITEVEQRNKFGIGDTVEIIQPGVKGCKTCKVEFLQDENGNDILTAPHAAMKLKMKLGENILPWSMIRKER